MTIVSRGAALVVLTLLPAAPLAQTAPGWSPGLHSRVRLFAAGAGPEGRLAGLEIVLDRGFKTYWRQPGESGLPPRFGWGGSANAAAVEVLWPAPTRVEDAGGVAYVYADRVVFPVRVRPAEPGKPVALRLSLDYGVCKEICIPAHADLAADLPADDAGADAIDRALVRREGLARVPAPLPLGGPGPLAVESVADAPRDGKPGYRVAVRGPADATLFVEGPEDWYVATSAPAGTGDFRVTIEEPKQPKGPAVLRLTLAAGATAIETELPLDDALRPR
jgi:DsbC/DsbD-like thiol-disulfide interchange protein